MIRKSFLFNMISFLVPLLGVIAGDNANQEHINAIVRDLFQRGVLRYVPLHGGALAQVHQVTIEPSSFVVRKINSNNSFESCVKESVVAEICAQQGIGPRLYAADPAQKLLFLEYLQSQAAPREIFGTEHMLHELGMLVARFHGIDSERVKKDAKDTYQVSLDMNQGDLWVLDYSAEKIEDIASVITTMGLDCAQVQQWSSYFKERLEVLHKETQLRIVFSHLDLHWGNCLYASGRFWLIDYESCGLAPWWYDLGVLGAHFSFFEEQDKLFLQGYFGIDESLISPQQKEQYWSMKYIAMLFYASNRLSHFAMEDIERAIAAHMDLNSIQVAYKANNFSLTSDFEHAQLAIAMIRHVGEQYKAII